MGQRWGAWLAVVVAAALHVPGGESQSVSGAHGTTREDNSCRYAHDGECDDPAAGTGACATGTDYGDCQNQNSCNYAHDDECDEPGPTQWGRTGTGRCEAGTDSDDCCPDHAHSSAGRVACTCNYNYRVDSNMRTCVSAAGAGGRPGAPGPDRAAALRSCYADCEAHEDAEEKSLCRDECEANDEYSGQAVLLLLAAVIILVFLFFPCIVFGFAHICCIRDRRKEGRQPVPQAWTVCTSLFVTALMCTWFQSIQILWFILPFFMVAPFCLDQCCAYNPLALPHQFT